VREDVNVDGNTYIIKNTFKEEEKSEISYELRNMKEEAKDENYESVRKTLESVELELIELILNTSNDMKSGIETTIILVLKSCGLSKCS